MAEEHRKEKSPPQRFSRRSASERCCVVLAPLER